VKAVRRGEVKLWGNISETGSFKAGSKRERELWMSSNKSKEETVTGEEIQIGESGIEKLVPE